jgi:hypothetical protein
MKILANDNLVMAKALEQQFHASLPVLPALMPATENQPTPDKTACTAFMNNEALPQKQLADLRAGSAAVEALWATIYDTPFWLTNGQWPLVRCILMALCLRDILHKCGRPDARLFRSGLDVRQVGGDFPRVLTIGDPTAAKLEGKWNAHMTVRLGDFLFDPSFGQTKRFWNSSPHCAAFLAAAPTGHTIDIAPGKHAPSLVMHRFSEHGHDFQVSYFKLTHKVDLRTRKWRSSPDARPERRRLLVHKAVAIYQAQFAEATRKAA